MANSLLVSSELRHSEQCDNVVGVELLDVCPQKSAGFAISRTTNDTVSIRVPNSKPNYELNLFFLVQYKANSIPNPNSITLLINL